MKRWLALALLIAPLAGCSAYQLRGKAVEGATSAIFIVDADDPRLERPGVAGANLYLILDPQRLSTKRLDPQATGADGAFAIRIGEFGAGVLEYEAQLEARASGFRGVAERFDLPGRDKRVLIVLEQGSANAAPRGESFLDETLRMGEPYMD
ncbi:MAG: hypothetical protein ACODAQ_03855 [Phycisphaeraceae bacterium]